MWVREVLLSLPRAISSTTTTVPSILPNRLWEQVNIVCKIYNHKHWGREESVRFLWSNSSQSPSPCPIVLWCALSLTLKWRLPPSSSLRSGKVPRLPSTRLCYTQSVSQAPLIYNVFIGGTVRGPLWLGTCKLSPGVKSRREEKKEGGMNWKRSWGEKLFLLLFFLSSHVPDYTATASWCNGRIGELIFSEDFPLLSSLLPRAQHSRDERASN